MEEGRFLLCGALFLNVQIDQPFGVKIQDAVGTGRGIAFIIFLIADAYNVIRAGVGRVVGGVAIQMQLDAAGCGDVGVFRNGKVIDHTFASRKFDQHVAGHGQVFGTQTAIVQRNSQRFQLHGRKADIAGLQADDQPSEGNNSA